MFNFAAISLFLVSVSFSILCMEQEPLPIYKALKNVPYATGDVFQKKLLPQLDLISVMRLGRTCKEFNGYCSVDKICMLPIEIPCLKAITDNYFYSTCTLSLLNKQIDIEENQEHKQRLENMFKGVWAFHEILRNEDIKRFTKKKYPNKIQIYKQYYNTIEDVCKGINRQLKEAIKTENVSLLNALMYDRNYDLFILFSGREIPKAIQSLCSICFQQKDTTILFRFIKNVLARKRKNILIKWIFFYGNDSLLCMLFNREVFCPNEKFRNGKTALHLAACYNYTDLIKLLLDNGQDINATTADNATALDYARYYRRYRAEQVILGYYQRRLPKR